MLYYNQKERGSPVSAGDLKPEGSAQGRVAEGPEGLPEKNKKIKKMLDKSQTRCYNEITKGKEKEIKKWTP